MIKKNIGTLLLITTLVMSLTACGGKGGKSSVSGNTRSVSDEIAETKTEEIIPQEAKDYTSVSFNIPEGLQPDIGNNDYKQYYLSNRGDDLSYIAYSRSDKPVIYTPVTQADFEESFLKKYNVEATISEFSEVEKEGYTRTKIVMEYTFGRTTYDATEYIFVTDKYIFTVCYCLDKTSGMSEDFANSADSMTLISVVESVSDNAVPGVEVSVNSAIMTEEEVMGKIKAGAEADQQ
jgi:hypothetical protein